MEVMTGKKILGMNLKEVNRYQIYHAIVSGTFEMDMNKKLLVNYLVVLCMPWKCFDNRLTNISSDCWIIEMLQSGPCQFIYKRSFFAKVLNFKENHVKFKFRFPYNSHNKIIRCCWSYALLKKKKMTIIYYLLARKEKLEEKNDNNPECMPHHATGFLTIIIPIQCHPELAAFVSVSHLSTFWHL